MIRGWNGQVGYTLSHSQRLRVRMLTRSVRAVCDWSILSWSRRLRRRPPMVSGSLGTGIPRLWEGEYSSRGMRKTPSQKGNVAHAVWQDQEHELGWANPLDSRESLNRALIPHSTERLVRSKYSGLMNRFSGSETHLHKAWEEHGDSALPDGPPGFTCRKTQELLGRIPPSTTGATER